MAAPADSAAAKPQARHPPIPAKEDLVPCPYRRFAASRRFVTVTAFAGLLAGFGCADAPSSAPRAVPAVVNGVGGDAASGTAAHRDLVMTSRFCASCHPDIYAEHMENTHGRAFLDSEARLATRDFRREDCVRCHTPRPIFETGIGLTPIARHHDLNDSNSCMTCHWRQDYDYSKFDGGEQCRSAFDGRVGEVAACATCHRVAGTPEQWLHAKNGKEAGRVCIDCHMPLVKRPVAVGEKPRSVRSHLFPASRSESQLRRAYSYDAAIGGNEAVVKITNSGVGHNFPTASLQRSLQSLIVQRDAEGKEIANDRVAFEHPYWDPTSLDLPVATQIPSGATRVQKVALDPKAATVECSLFFKTYHPIADNDPDLSRRLEWRVFTVDRANMPPAITDAVPTPPSPPAAVTPAEAARNDGFAKFAKPPPGTKTVAIPTGDSDEDIARLLSFFDFPVPAARAAGRARLVEIGEKAIPAVIRALGHWSNDTYEQAMETLIEMGPKCGPALREALHSDSLYVRYHARKVLVRLSFPGDHKELRKEFVRELSLPAPLDRRGAAEALADFDDSWVLAWVRPLLDDPDWDVVAAAAHTLARLNDPFAVEELTRTLARATFIESRRDLALALAELGSDAGIQVLFDGLDDEDDVVRKSCFDALFSVTGMHESYDPGEARPVRLESITRLQQKWAMHGGAAALQRPIAIDPVVYDHAWHLVETLGGGTDVDPGGDDKALMEELVSMGPPAVPAIVDGLTFPTGFSEKRALVCEALGRIGDTRGAPALVAALRDPKPAVAQWAAWSLESTGDAACLPALHRYLRRLESLAVAGPKRDAAIDQALAHAQRTCYRLGDPAAAIALESLAKSADPTTRSIAAEALASR
jgi:HEAT repeat protein